MKAHEHPDCRAAIAYGIDLTLLEANLQLSPAERLRQHDLLLVSFAAMQLRTVPAALRDALEAEHVAEARRLGGPLSQVE